RSRTWAVRRTVVGKEQPSLRVSGILRRQFRPCDLLRATGKNYRMRSPIGIRAVGYAERVGESTLAQQAFPFFLRNTRLVRAQIVILEQPPAFQQSENQVQVQ